MLVLGIAFLKYPEDVMPKLSISKTKLQISVLSMSDRSFNGRSNKRTSPSVTHLLAISLYPCKKNVAAKSL